MVRCVGGRSLGEPALPFLLTISGPRSPFSHCLARGADGNRLNTEPAKPPAATPSGSPPDYSQHSLTLVALGHSGFAFKGYKWLGELLESRVTPQSALSSGPKSSLRCSGPQCTLVGANPAQVVTLLTHKLRGAPFFHVNLSWMGTHLLFISVALSSHSALSSRATAL